MEPTWKSEYFQCALHLSYLPTACDKIPMKFRE